MAARLEWCRPKARYTVELRLGTFTLGRVIVLDGNEFGYRIGDNAYSTVVYQSEADAMQDLESEVRRLLKEAGVEVEP